MRIKENKFLLHDVYNKFLKDYPDGTTISNFCKNWDTQNYLEIAQEKPEKILSDNCIDSISDTISHLQNIVKRPKTFIKSIEEKTPVETAKKINNQAITRLGRDSNDWYARTFLTVKPKKISSDINYEKLDIYENKVIKNLIDKIYYYLIESNRMIEDLAQKANANQVQIKMKNEYGFSNFDGTNNLFKRFNQFNTVGDVDINEITERQIKINRLLNSISNLKGSEFCKSLKKIKQVAEPIRKTNIFMYDKRYKACYDLWQVLRNNKQEEDIDYVDDIEVNASDYYFAYVVICIIASMFNNDYELITNPTMVFKNNKLVFSGEVEWKTNFNNIKLTIDSNNNILTFNYCIDVNKNKWDRFDIQVDYVNFEGMDRIEISSQTDKFIDNMLKRNKYEKVSSKYYIVSVDFSCLPDIGERLYRRFYSIGDNYCENEPRIREIGNYHTGMIIVNPMDARLNSINIQRIINSHIYRSIKYDGVITSCPICGNKNIKVTNNSDIICKQCKHMISMASSCNHCHEDNIVWVRYDENKFLKDEDLCDKLKNDHFYYQLMNMQKFMGQYAITSFSLEQSDKKMVLKTICPKCGRKLGDD